MNDLLPILAITMGDPAGVGPEIIVRALARVAVHAVCRPLVVGDARIIARAAKVLHSDLAVRPVERVADAAFAVGTLDVFDQQTLDPDQLAIGKVSAVAGHAAFEAIRAAIGLAMRGEVHGTVTTPIHKEALALAGHKFPGHTEIFAHFTGTRDYTMMLAAGDLRVVHVSTHVSLRQACDAVTRKRVREVIDLAAGACRRLGIDDPLIGVAGLNPHASDGGLFGSEESEHIAPAIEDARRAGLRVEGPLPPDTFFAKASGGAYDICVAMYHDQGHIPVKIRGFRYDAREKRWTSVNGINVSLGLPIVRASVDHGTAYDQAWQGTASDESLVQAIEYAARMATKSGRPA
jgi:4-phospho-D-threonate 3-dehydrogenase / 4-phospho-D-erythronate 3-dehydrogenase